MKDSFIVKPGLWRNGSFKKWQYIGPFKQWEQYEQWQGARSLKDIFRDKQVFGGSLHQMKQKETGEELRLEK